MVKFVPSKVQKEGIQWVVKKSFAGLFWDPGRGKTITMLEAFQILKEEGLVRNMLVTANTNIVDDVWPNEIEKFDDLNLTYSSLRGGAGKRENALDLDADVFLINNENLYWLWATYGKKLGIDMLVVDESSKFRNGRLRRKKKRVKSAFYGLIQMIPNFKRRYILTGNPIPKGYLNLWPQMYLVDRGESLGDNIRSYKNRYFVPEGFKGKEVVLREGADEEIRRAISGRVHRAERDMSVPIEFFSLSVRLPPKARKAYEELEREFIVEWKNKVLLAQNAAVATSKLRQAANGAVYYDRKRSWIALHERKVEALSELMDELQGQPLLIALEFESDYEMITRSGLKIPFYRGSREYKKELKQAWDRGELPGLAANIESISHGMNFQYGGRNLLYYGLTFNLDAYEQFYQRIWRTGQNYGVIAYDLVAEDTVEDAIAQVLEERDATQKKFLKALKRRYREIKVDV